MRVYSSNLIKESTLSPSTVEVNNNVEVLKQLTRKTTFTFTGNDESIIIAFLEAKEVKSILLDIGNLSPTAIVSIDGNNTADFTTPDYTQSLTYAYTAFYADIDTNYKYYRLNISDSSLATIQIGLISIGGSYIQMPPINPQITLKYETLSTQTDSIAGVSYGNRRYGRLRTALSFPKIKDTSFATIGGVIAAGRQEILAAWDSILNITPVWVFLFSENLDEIPPELCVIDQSELTFKKLRGDGKNYSLPLKLKGVK